MLFRSGIISLLLVYRVIADPPWATRKAGVASRIDYIGISLLALGVGALQIMLDKGQEDDWFGSNFITTLAILAVVGLVSLVIWEWFTNDPIIDLRMYRNFNFVQANIMIFILGLVLFAALVMLPLFLQTLRREAAAYVTKLPRVAKRRLRGSRRQPRPGPALQAWSGHPVSPENPTFLGPTLQTKK